MLAKTPLIDIAIAWVQQQNPRHRYEWVSRRLCACGLLSRDIGRFDEWSAFSRQGRFEDIDQATCEWSVLKARAHKRPHTFGSFLKRLRAYSMTPDIGE